MSGQYMVNTKPVIYVHWPINTHEFFGPRVWGWCTALEGHTEDFDYETCGLTAEPGKRCVGLDEAIEDSCTILASIVLACSTAIEGHYGRLHLCGAHYLAHQNGIQVRLAV
jgi:hypothetical protein